MTGNPYLLVEMELMELTQPYSVWRVSRNEVKGATDALSLTVLGARHHRLHNSLLVS